MSQKKQPFKSEKTKTGNELITFAFTKQNYRLLIIGIIFITLGFLLMIGGGSDDPKVFSDKIFNFQRMTLAPILIIAGYIIEIFAIMKRPKQ
jgi:cytochrome bd-type quinol oxidase subunit 2